MNLTFTREVRASILRDVCGSVWMRQFLTEMMRAHKLTGQTMIERVRKGVEEYLHVRERPTLIAQGYTLESIERELRSVAEDIVVLRPRNRARWGVYVLAKRSDVSELGDTHDGEYEQVAPPFVRHRKA